MHILTDNTTQMLYTHKSLHTYIYDYKFPYHIASIKNLTLTVFVGFIMDFTKFDDSIVHERTVSVLPSRKSRVMDAS